MKLFMYLGLILFLNCVRSQYTDYNILQDVIKIYENYTLDTGRIDFTYGSDGLPVYKFDNESVVSAPAEKISLNDISLSSPFILNIMFKFEKVEYSCMLAILDSDKQVKLRLCLTPKALDVVTVNLDSSGFRDSVNLNVIYEDFSNNWMDVYIVFGAQKVTIYVKCEFSEAIELTEIMEDINFSRDTWVYIGQSGTSKKFPFKGAIQKIVLYTNTDDVEKVCSDEIYIPDSFKGDLDSGTSTTEDEYSEMNLKGEKGERGEIGAKGERGETGAKGVKGDKGEPGESITGPRGTQGPIGPQGPVGSKGEEGVCQCSESVISTLLKNIPEMKGPRGEPGPRGADGDIGITGKTGLPGKQGERGPVGLKGDKGDRGVDGIPGRDGEFGPKGEPGRDGTPGLQGSKGDIGLPGPPGLACEREKKPEKVVVAGQKGDIGPMGPEGPQGIKGEKGEKGTLGDRGLPGKEGERGHDGPQGLRGEKGEVGNPGLNGESGVPGTHGKPGEKGDKGDVGERGAMGPPGMPAKLASILDDELDPYQKTMIVEKLRGYKGDPGEKGDKGNMGAKGSSGSPGLDGVRGKTGEKGDVGHTGLKGNKGEKGEMGPPGVVPLSTLHKLKGVKGDRGPMGKSGSRGPMGYGGKKGSVGASGHKGNKGEIGVPGPMGPSGSPGIPGTKGEKGERGEKPEINLEKLKGDKGEMGVAGAPGEAGKMGPPGLCQKTEDSVPVPGPPGPPGPSGSPGPPGPPGPAGAPGISVTGPKGEPGGIISDNTLYHFSRHTVDLDEDDGFYKMETLVYKTSKALKRRTRSTPLGTLAYILEEKLLLLRVEHGWQYVVMGSLFKEKVQRPKNIATHENVRGKGRKNFIRLAALDEPYSGKMETATNRTGRKTVDQECHVQSKKAGFTGTFAAFLANNVEDLKSVLKTSDKDVAVLNIHQQLLFDSWIDMFNESGTTTVNADIYSFSGKNVLIDPTWPLKAIWHGSNSLGVRSPKFFCQEWRSDSPKHFGTATKINDNMVFTHERYTCDKKLIVLCVEVRPNIVRRQRHISRRRNAYAHLTSNRN